MNQSITRLVGCMIAVLFACSAQAQLVSPTAGPAETKNGRVKITRNLRTQAIQSFDERLKPFYHGVASGDPLSDRVIIWTRITPETDGPVEVAWKMATDPEMSSEVASGTFTTSVERDYTVKIDVTGLTPASTYYYQFDALGGSSIVGRTKTTPSDNAEHLRFAVVSCQNYEAGYFGAYAALGERNDLDAVIHLGDYIYEYGNGTYGIDDPDRYADPANEILTLADYRTRYSSYRLDQDLMRAHQQHPFITVWDDHESANDAYKDGAENHNEGEGSWEERKAISKQVYAEWMPIRGEAQSVYRKIQYGDLMDLIMVDTRIEGRDEQINDFTSPALYDPNRTLLGAQQKGWFYQQLATSQAKWKVIGNQVIFSELVVGWAGPATGQTFEETESLFMDIWDGYPAERLEIMGFMAQSQLSNVIWLTGDFHCAFAYDITPVPSQLSATVLAGIPGLNAPTYDATTGTGSIGVEFATPSIASANFDENLDLLTATALEQQMNQPLPESAGAFAGINPNPHMKFVDLVRHGYFILDLTEDKAQADWYFIDDILTQTASESLAASWFTNNNENRLQEATGESAGKANQDQPAPPIFVTPTADEDERFATVLSVYPNPASELLLANYAINKKSLVRISLVDLGGKEVAELMAEEMLGVGNYTLTADLREVTPGTYLLRFNIGEGQYVRKVIVK